MSDFSAWLGKNKALWTRVYDEVIAPDLEGEWQKREELHKEELKQKEENQQILFNHVEDEINKNSRLVSENEQLKYQMGNLAENTTTKSDAASNLDTEVAGSLTVDAHAHGRLVDKYNELSKKYQDLSQKLKYLERKNNAVMQKNKDMKQSVRAWQEYADRQSGRQKPKSEVNPDDVRPRLPAVLLTGDVRPCMPSSPGSIATVRTPFSPAGKERSSPTPNAPTELPEVGAPDMSVSPRNHEDYEAREARSQSSSITPKPPSFIRSSPQQQMESDTMPCSDVSSNTVLDGNISRRLQSYLQAVNPSSSQTTEDESTEQAVRHTQFTTNTDDENEVPQFVSARSLKRKRGPSSKIEIHGDRSSDGTPVKPFQVKDEQLSSPPNIHSLLRKETLDLDIPTLVGLQTPRHCRPKLAVQSNTTSKVRNIRSSSAPFTQDIKREDPHSEHLAELPDNHAVLNKPEATNNETRAQSEPSDSNESMDNILRHLDPNTVGNIPEERSKKRMKESMIREQNVHMIFSEYGEEPTPTNKHASSLAPSFARAKLNRNLYGSSGGQPYTNTCQRLTSTSATTGIKIEQNPTPPSSSSRIVQTPLAKVRQRQPNFGASPVGSDISTAENRPQWRMKASESRPSARKPAGSPPKNLGRLRSKPVTQLSVQDFKPNPVYNQGYSYAFSETVRKRSDRLCLPGCTNSECCGSTFRTFAEAQAPLPSSQEEALLEEYLGEAYNNINMTQMSTEEREELVLQARTKKMAKEAGKHREAYERRRTPPGFWRVDFPSTQELKEDRERAKEQERRVVQERWLEAQRKGGRWIFKDE